MVAEAARVVAVHSDVTELDERALLNVSREDARHPQVGGEDGRVNAVELIVHAQVVERKIDLVVVSGRLVHERHGRLVVGGDFRRVRTGDARVEHLLLRVDQQEEHLVDVHLETHSHRFDVLDLVQQVGQVFAGGHQQHRLAAVEESHPVDDALVRRVVAGKVVVTERVAHDVLGEQDLAVVQRQLLDLVGLDPREQPPVLGHEVALAFVASFAVADEAAVGVSLAHFDLVVQVVDEQQRYVLHVQLVADDHQPRLGRNEIDAQTAVLVIQPQRDRFRVDFFVLEGQRNRFGEAVGRAEDDHFLLGFRLQPEALAAFDGVPVLAGHAALDIERGPVENGEGWRSRLGPVVQMHRYAGQRFALVGSRLQAVEEGEQSAVEDAHRARSQRHFELFGQVDRQLDGAVGQHLLVDDDHGDGLFSHQMLRVAVGQHRVLPLVLVVGHSVLGFDFHLLLRVLAGDFGSLDVEAQQFLARFVL